VTWRRAGQKDSQYYGVGKIMVILLKSEGKFLEKGRPSATEKKAVWGAHSLEGTYEKARTGKGITKREGDLRSGKTARTVRHREGSLENI